MFDTDFATDIVADAAQAWDFRSTVAGGSYAIDTAARQLALAGTGTAGRDTITNSTSTDSSISLTHPMSLAAAGGPSHAGSFFVVMECATDVGWRKGWDWHILAMPASGQAGVRFSLFKPGNNDSEFPQFFVSHRNTAVNGVALNQSVNQSGAGWDLMTGCPAYMGLQHTPITGSPLSADMPAAGVFRAVYSVDGFTWVTVTGMAADFEPTELRLGCGKATQGTMGTFRANRFVDMLNLGNVTAAWDIRRPVPTDLDRTTVSEIMAGAVALPAGWVDDSRSPGGTSTATFVPEGLRFDHSAVPDARQGVQARVRYTGQTVDFADPDTVGAGVLYRLRCPDDNVSCFLTAGLVTDLGVPTQYPVTAIVRASNVLTVTTSGTHRLKQGQVCRLVVPNDAGFAVTGTPLSTVAATSATIAQTGSDGSASNVTGAYLEKVNPIDQYTRGPLFPGLEIRCGGQNPVIRRPIQVQWFGPDWANDGADVWSVPGSTQLEETPYFHMKQIDDPTVDLGQPALVIVVQLERLRDPAVAHSERLRVRSWASVSANVETDLAHGEDAGLPWAYVDANTDVGTVAGFTAVGPAWGVSHNGGGKTGTLQVITSALRFYEITEAAASGGGAAAGGLPVPRARWRRRARR